MIAAGQGFGESSAIMAASYAIAEFLFSRKRNKAMSFLIALKEVASCFAS